MIGPGLFSFLCTIHMYFEKIACARVGRNVAVPTYLKVLMVVGVAPNAEVGHLGVLMMLNYFPPN